MEKNQEIKIMIQDMMVKYFEERLLETAEKSKDIKNIGEVTTLDLIHKTFEGLITEESENEIWIEITGKKSIRYAIKTIPRMLDDSNDFIEDLEQYCRSLKVSKSYKNDILHGCNYLKSILDNAFKIYQEVLQHKEIKETLYLSKTEYLKLREFYTLLQEYSFALNCIIYSMNNKLKGKNLFEDFDLQFFLEELFEIIEFLTKDKYEVIK